MSNSEETKKKLQSASPSVTNIYDGEIISVVKYRISDHTYECVLHPQAVTMIPQTKDGKLIFVKQYRYPVDQIMLEFPAGNMFPSEDPFMAANRELQEEIGFRAETLILLESIFSSPGFCNEYLHLFLAKDLVESAFIAEDTFEIDIVELTLDEVYAKIRNHEIIDAKTLCSILLFENWRKENSKL